MATRGQGRVYQISYPVVGPDGQPVVGPDGKPLRQKAPTWWVQYSHRGKMYRESSKSDRKADAIALLRKRLGALTAGSKPILDEKRVTMAALFKRLVEHYTDAGNRSTATLTGRIAHLREFLGEETPAIEITADRILAYRRHRLAQKAATATINREVAAVSKAYSLAVEVSVLSTRPVFPSRLPEPEARQNFIEPEQYVALRGALDPDLADVLDFGFATGWRKQEITTLTWAEVDLKAAQITLRAARSKNKKPRIIGLAGPALVVLERRARLRRPGLDLVFFQEDGTPIGDFRKRWISAVKAAGLPAGTRFHDLRRSAIRGLVRAGVPEATAMRISGHRTRSTFERYNIVKTEDTREALAAVAASLPMAARAAQKAASSRPKRKKAESRQSPGLPKVQRIQKVS